MSTVQFDRDAPELVPTRLGPESNGMRMSPDEFDAVTDYDRRFQYELVDGVVLVNPLPRDAHSDPNILLGHLLYIYRTTNPQGNVLDYERPERYVKVRNGRRIADHVLWIGLGRRPSSRDDVPTIAVEFVSAGRRNRYRDYVLKRDEYLAAGIREYWIFDRFDRTLTVHRRTDSGEQSEVFTEEQLYRPLLLPGFDLSVEEILSESDAAPDADDASD